MNPAALIPLTKHGPDVIPWERRCPLAVIEDLKPHEGEQLEYEVQIYAIRNGFKYWTTHVDWVTREFVIQMFRTEMP